MICLQSTVNCHIFLPICLLVLTKDRSIYSDDYVNYGMLKSWDTEVMLEPLPVQGEIGKSE